MNSSKLDREEEESNEMKGAYVIMDPDNEQTSEEENVF